LKLDEKSGGYIIKERIREDWSPGAALSQAQIFPVYPSHGHAGIFHLTDQIPYNANAASYSGRISHHLNSLLKVAMSVAPVAQAKSRTVVCPRYTHHTSALSRHCERSEA
jgi:hypothetical protein